MVVVVEQKLGLLSLVQKDLPTHQVVYHGKLWPYVHSTRDWTSPTNTNNCTHILSFYHGELENQILVFL